MAKLPRIGCCQNPLVSMATNGDMTKIFVFFCMLMVLNKRAKFHHRLIFCIFQPMFLTKRASQVLQCILHILPIPTRPRALLCDLYNRFYLTLNEYSHIHWLFIDGATCILNNNRGAAVRYAKLL